MELTGSKHYARNLFSFLRHALGYDQRPEQEGQEHVRGDENDVVFRPGIFNFIQMANLWMEFIG
jgi:hypothetical protein